MGEQETRQIYVGTKLKFVVDIQSVGFSMDSDDFTEHLNGCFWPTMRIAIFVIVAMFFLSSCATKTKIEYRDRDVNHYITNTVHDTLIQHTRDSIYHTIVQKGDTVYDTRYVEKTRWRDKIVERYDTCWRDSVVTEYKETVKEITKIPKIYKVSLFISILCIIFAIVKFSTWLKIR